MSKLHRSPATATTLGRRRAMLLAGAAAGALAVSLAIPREAAAADECGAPTAGVVTCATGNYPDGVAYTTLTGLEVVVAPGATVGGDGPNGAILVTQAAGGVGDLVVSAAGAASTSTDIQVAGLLVSNSGAGDTMVTGGTHTASGAGGAAIAASAAGGAVTITSNVATATGNGSLAIYASGRDGVTVTAATTTSNGSTINPNGTINPGGSVLAAGIIALSSQGPITIHSGAVTATGIGASGVIAVSDGAAGDITLNVTGDVSSSVGHATYLDAKGGGEVVVNVAAGRTVSGLVTGVNAIGPNGATITNAGVIKQTGADLNEDDDLDYAAINIAAEGTPVGSTVNNSGSILARDQNSIAVWFDAGDDTLNLSTGSTIVGRLIGAGGLDTINLAGSINTRTTQQVLGGAEEFERLNASSGYWTMNGVVSADTVNVAAGATLEIHERLSVDQEAYFESAAGLPAVNVDGRLIIDSDDTAIYADSADLAISGAGQVELRGGGQFLVDGPWALQGTVTIGQDSRLVVTGRFDNDLVIASGGTVLIGATLAAEDADPGDSDTLVVTGPGTSGDVTGDIQADGSLIFNRSDAYTYSGALSGTGDLYLTGGGTVTIGGAYLFAGVTHRESGQLILTSVNTEGEFEVGDEAVVHLSGGDQTVGGLSGGGEIVVNDGSLTIEQDPGETSTFGGTLSGDGDLNVTGGGTFDLTGDNTYTGDTSVNGGSTLKVNGSITSDVEVGEGGTLGGSGEIGGDVEVGDGGVFSPGNSPGVTTVVGDVTFAAGSTYAFEVDPGAVPDHDLIQITGGEAIVDGGTLAVQAAGVAGDYGRRTVYTSITADGGVTGAGFDAVTSSAAFLTAYVVYGANDVDVVLVNNTVSLATVGLTANQTAVGAALSAAGPATALYDTVAPQEDAGVRAAADALSGEAFATQNALLLQRTSHLRRAVSARPAEPVEGGAVWGEVFDRSGQIDATDGVAGADSGASGLLAGVEGDLGGWRIGATVGYSQGDLDSPGGRIEADTLELGGYVAAGLGAWRVGFTGAYARHALESSRRAAFAGFANTLTAEYDAVTAQVSAELAYGGFSPASGLRLEPFVGVQFVSLTADAFTETGGAAALTVAEQSQEVATGVVGVRLTGEMAAGDGALSPRVSLAWRAASGDSDGASTHRFGAGPAFTVQGADLLSDVAEIGAGVDWRSGPVTLSLGYRGDVGDRVSEHSATLGGAVRF